MSPFTPDLRLHDRYVLHERIGLGGMSEVWRADDEVLGRPVAVKVLAGSFAVDPELRAAIRREARAAARLAHPHVTQVYDYGEATLDGTVVPYLVMELVDGRTLADLLAEGPLPWPAALRMAAQVAAALAAAHRIGVVHRDIKPGNVMLTETGAKVLDFGIAAIAGPQHVGAGPVGEPMMGTPAYTAPERLTAGAPDPASDVYALGALLYRTLTGTAPLPVHSWEDALVVHADRRPVPPLRVSGLPDGPAALVHACLDPDPARRPTAGQLAARFRVTSGEAVGTATTVLPVVPPTAASEVDDAPRPASTHPATLVDRAGARARPRESHPDRNARRERTTPTRNTGPAAAGAARGTARPGPTTGRQRRAGPPVGVLLAAGLVLLLGVGAVLAVINSGDGEVPTAAPGTAQAAAPTVSAAAPTGSAAPRPSPAASTSGPDPVSLRQDLVDVVAMLTAAQLTGDLDRKAADRLRKDLTDLGRGRAKDQEKRIDDLRERLEKEVERGRVPAELAGRLDELLDRFEAASPEDEDD